MRFNKPNRSVLTTFFVIVFLGTALLYAASSSSPSVSLTLSLNPTIVPPGGTVTATATVQNTSAAKEQVTIDYEISGPCGVASIGSVHLILRAGETRSASVSYSAPACPGDYTITLTAVSGGAVLATTSATLTVQ